MRKRRTSIATRPTAIDRRMCSASDDISRRRLRKMVIPSDANPKQKPPSKITARNSPNKTISGATSGTFGCLVTERTEGNTKRTLQLPKRKSFFNKCPFERGLLVIHCRSYDALIFTRAEEKNR